MFDHTPLKKMSHGDQVSWPKTDDGHGLWAGMHRGAHTASDSGRHGES